jgi:hypothetical protein
MQVTISKRYSDTPKAIIKHANAKALRRQNRLEIELAFAPEPEEPLPDDTYEFDLEFPRETYVAAAVLVWDDGLDYDVDGNAYVDDCPGYHPHSYHHSLKDAESEIAWLIHRGLDSGRITLIEGYPVSDWDTHRIP